MQGLFFILISLIMLGRLWVHAEHRMPKIGIIGGGIGGTSCAYFLNSILKEAAVDVVIDVFEAEKVGGRLALVDIANRHYEEGGSIIHSRNKYMVDFLKKFNLKKRKHEDGYFALYDGKEFVFSESQWQLVTLLKVLYRYGYGFWKLRSYIEDMLTKFERIYKLQDDGVTFNTVSSLLAAMDPKFVDYLHVTTKQGFEKQGISKAVVDEIIMATTRANYGQALNMHKMVGSVSVAGVIGSMWGVHGGNVQIPELLLKASTANLVNLVVTSVEKTPLGLFQIKTKGNSSRDDSANLYDVIIIATPQTYDSKYEIKFEGFDEEIKFSGRYHKTVCTILEGTLSPSFLENKDPFIDEILTTSEDVSFNSIGRIAPVDYTPKKDGKSNVWKVFTQERMNDSMLEEMFSVIKKKHVKEWLAYPHYGHSRRNDSFILAPNLYHINAIEWAASAMEMSVIGARNVALMASQWFLDDERDETTTWNSRRETSTRYPQHETVTEYPLYEITNGNPRQENTPGYPLYESTSGNPSHESTPENPLYESTSGNPSHENTPEYARDESTPGSPPYETTPVNTRHESTPVYESTAVYYRHENTPEYPRYETTPVYPRYETTAGYPRHESTPGYPPYEPTPGHPRYEPTAGYPRHETEPPRYETTPGYPRRETEYPRYEPTAVYPRHENTPEYPRYETTPWYPRYDTTPGYPRREPEYPRYETTPGYPRREPEYPRYETTPGYPRREPEYPRYDTTRGYPRHESTDYPRYQTTPGYPRHEPEHPWYEPTPGYPRHEPEHPRYEPTPGYPRYEPDHPRYEPTPGYPRHEPEHPRYETTPRYPRHEPPRYETTPGYPRHEPTDYPRYETTPAYPRYDNPPYRAGISKEKEEL